MGISVSLLLAAIGAGLIWAVDTSVSGLNIHVVGVILLIVGLVGLVISLFYWASWGGFGGFRHPRDPGETVVRERVVER